VFNNFFIRLWAALTTVVDGAHRRVAQPARGANFIEYAMLGVIAVFIGFIFRKQLSDAFSSILDQITGGLEGGGSENGNATP
jgi:Flp pilus assembly pilin Flp